MISPIRISDSLVDDNQWYHLFVLVISLIQFRVHDIIYIRIGRYHQFKKEISLFWQKKKFKTVHHKRWRSWNFLKKDLYMILFTILKSFVHCQLYYLSNIYKCFPDRFQIVPCRPSHIRWRGKQVQFEVDHFQYYILLYVIFLSN